MRKITTGIYTENKYPSVQLGVIVSNDGLLLIDNPIRLEDGRSWLSQVSDLGKPHYAVLLDHHPDRVVGARDLNMPLIGHQFTRQYLASRPDSFKGNTHPIGAETDRLKRITGLTRSIPDLSFKHKMKIRLGELEIEFWHKPGPTPGAIWVVNHKRKILFIGDAVTVDEPPYIGAAEIPKWLESLDFLRSSMLESHRIISSRDGVVKRNQITQMARFLRKVKLRVERLEGQSEIEAASKIAAREVLKGYKLSGTRADIAQFRLKIGFEDLHTKLYKSKDMQV